MLKSIAFRLNRNTKRGPTYIKWGLLFYKVRSCLAGNNINGTGPFLALAYLELNLLSLVE